MKWNDLSPDQQREALMKKGWFKLTFDDFLSFEIKFRTNSGIKANTMQNWIHLHKHQVREALRLGLPVPNEVLNDYPEYRHLILDGKEIKQAFNYEWCHCGSLQRPQPQELEYIKDLEAKVLRLKAGLEKIHQECGAVCANFEMCSHAECDSSAFASIVAGDILREEFDQHAGQEVVARDEPVASKGRQ